MMKDEGNDYFKSLYTLKFWDEQAEKFYLKFYANRTAKIYPVMFILTTSLLFLYSIPDFIIAQHSNPKQLFLIRSILALTYLPMLLYRFKFAKQNIDLFNSVNYLIVAVGLEIIAVSYSPLDKVMYYGNYGGLSLVIIGACNCLLIRFIPALLSSLAVLISFYFVAVANSLDPSIIINVEMFLSSMCILGLFGAYTIEKLMRINFMREEKLRTKTREVEDSIIYASYIQQALLSSREILETSDLDNFIFYKPRDIVSGDFYWFRRIKNYLYFAAADCTGHGVPGAFMSVMCMSMLNEIVTKRDLNPPAMILNDLRKRIKKSLQQDQQSSMSHSGMDITLCLFDFETRTLQFAGAFNPLYVIRKDEFIEYKVDRMPIGAYPKDNISFNNHEIQLQKGDTLYIFSDGFISQFGGPNNKKFTAREFKRLLFNIYKQPMESQHQHLMDTFFYWKKNYEQLDDILVIGIKV